ncbi:MAG: OmpH family outer membrane protein [Candidatus Delongbacteria bacterium]|nr:OmpH family outer membrane protein [Candidatus Delongbacteria bacterium]MBN2833406.1 OmpH family outer membrane protein [Candidatus Delongbacteria bacterium]
MKKVVALLITLMAFSVFGELKFGYINAERIMTEYSESKKATEELQKLSKDRENEAMKMEAELKKLDEELKNMSMMLSEDKKREKMEEGKKKLVEYQAFKERVWGSEGELARKNIELTNPLLKKINDAIKVVSEKEGMDYVFDATNGTLVYSKPDYDLTDKILMELNK